MAKGFVGNIEDEACKNTFFRKVLYTGKHSQLVVMSLKPGEEIGVETHPDNDQFFRIEEGMAKVLIDDNQYEASAGFAILIPAGSKHNVKNASDTEYLKVYTIYSPAHHKDGTIHDTKEIALFSEEEFDGTTSE